MKKLFAMMIFVLVAMQCAYAQDKAYQRIQPNMRVTIELKGVGGDDASRVSGVYTVGANGTIKPPYLDSPVRLSGKTSREAEDSLSAAYKKEQIYTKPSFIVSFSATEDTKAQYMVDVSGKVNRAGPVPYRDNLTLGSAIVAAGDITVYGSRKVQLTRRGVTKTYDYYNARDRSIPLQPGDQIHVKDRGALEGRPSGIK